MTREAATRAEAVSPEEVAAWRDLTATRAFLADLVGRQTEAAQTWAAKGYQRETADATTMANSEALGGMQVLQSLIDFLRGE